MSDRGTRSTLRGPRYVVTELTGYLTINWRAGKGREQGASYHVIDTRWNHRLIATYRSEDYRSTNKAGSRELARRRAVLHAEALNETGEFDGVFRGITSQRWATC